MSNALAVATVTASLAHQLSRVIKDGSTSVPGARVTFLPPSNEGLQSGDPLVNLFLFKVVPNAYHSHADLPAREAGGRSWGAIDLDYMISFFGDDARLEPQRLLGLVVAGIHAEPILSRAVIQDTIATTAWLAASDLALQTEAVKLTPMAPEQTDQPAFAHPGGRLSVFYRASTVLLDAPSATA